MRAMVFLIPTLFLSGFAEAQSSEFLNTHATESFKKAATFRPILSKLPRIPIEKTVTEKTLLLTRGRSLVAFWKKGEYGAMHAAFSEGFKKHVPRKAFEEFLMKPEMRFVDVFKDAVETRGEGAAYVVYVRTEVQSLRIIIAFDSAGAAIMFKPSAEGAMPYPSPYAGKKPPEVLAFPFSSDSGTWKATGEHHTTVRAQRFALDLLIERDGKTFEGERSDVNAYFAYGKVILSPSGGEVLAVGKNMPDMDPSNYQPVTDNVGRLGNYVLLKSDTGMLILLAHMKPGSVAVSPRQKVTAGQALGRVGNSGNTTEPHLHMHVFDRMPESSADAYPIHFRDVLFDGSAKDEVFVEPGHAVGAAQ